MIYSLLADGVVIIHFLFILFAMFGGLLVLYKRWFIWLHLPAMAWGATIVLFGWICPLTPLEKWLLRLAGHAGYEGGFIEHYLFRVIYPEGLTRNIQILLGIGLLTLNLMIYTAFLLKRRKRQQINRRPPCV